MPPKPDSKPATPTVKTATATICGVPSPGPKYQLKTLVGYQRHCLSKYRNPAYTFGGRFPALSQCKTPGPYLLPDRKLNGFTFGHRLKGLDVFCGPGPKYILPDSRGPAFSIKFRTKPRGGCPTPGPYNVVLPRNSPAFSIGMRTRGAKCDPVPGPYCIPPVKPTPMFSIASRIPDKTICRSPGPKYHPKIPRPKPIYSFGVKHSECAPPYITECDDPC